MYTRVTVAQNKSDMRWYLVDKVNGKVWTESFGTYEDAVARLKSLFAVCLQS